MEIQTLPTPQENDSFNIKIQKHPMLQHTANYALHTFAEKWITFQWLQRH